MSKNDLNTKLQQIIENAKARGYSEEEIQALMEFPKRMASKVVKDFLLAYIEERKGRPDATKECKGLGDKLIGMMRVFPACDFTGSQNFSFFEHPWKLVLQLAVVEKTHNFEFTVGQKYMQQLFREWDNLTNMAKAYYAESISRNSKFLKAFAKFAPEFNVAELLVDINNRTLYFDESATKRIGVQFYYVDEHGKPITHEDAKANAVVIPEDVKKAAD